MSSVAEPAILRGFAQDIKLFGSMVFLTLRPLASSTLNEPVQFVFKDSGSIDLLRTVPRQSYVQVEGVPQQVQRFRKGISYVGTRLVRVHRSVRVRGDTLSHPRKGPLGCKYDVHEYRRPQYHRVVVARALMCQAMREVLIKRGFVQIFTPKLVTQSSEGGAQVFKLVHGGVDLYLSQSPQLMKQQAINMGLGRVFQIGPMFRAQKFNTPRHANEAHCLDVQMVCDHEDQVMAIVTAVIQATHQALGLDPVDQSHFTTVTYARALQIAGSDRLNAQSQRRVVQWAHTPYVYVTNYPFDQRPFYAKKGHTFDLLCGFSELVSGGLRQTSHGALVAQVQQKGLSPQGLAPYLQSFTLGAPPSGGFGLGLDRLLAHCLRLPSIGHTRVFNCQ